MADATPSIHVTLKTRVKIEDSRISVDELVLLELYLPDLIKQALTLTEGKEE